MKKIISIYDFYKDGFRSMTLGKHLWKIIFLKLFIILIVLQTFVYDRSLSSEFNNTDEKATYVYENLKGD